MEAVLIIAAVLCVFLAVQYTRVRFSIRSLRMQLEEILRGSHMELGIPDRHKELLALCRTLNQLEKAHFQAQLKYEKAEKQLKQNIVSLAHDIRTPLTGAAGYAQMAAECKEPEKRERYLKTALGCMAELGDMLEELFLYTKLSSTEFEPNMCEIQVFPLLSDCLVGMYRQFEERNISPEVEFESESVRIQADEECLRRIFHNLIQNALLHGEGGLFIRQRGFRMIFENSVPETGSPDPEQIFDQFYKADSARRKGSSGLGLFIVKELMERMKGSVKAELEGRSLRIILEFPDS